MYNIAFTSLPIIVFCVFDQDVPKALAARSPMLYTPGIRRTAYTHRSFATWMLEAIYLAMLSIYLPALALGYPGGPPAAGADPAPGWSLSSPPNGDPGISTISMTAMTLVCLGVNLRLAIEIHSWSGIEHLVMWGSLGLIELACLLFSFVWYPTHDLPSSYGWNELHGIVFYVWEDFAYWAVREHAPPLRRPCLCARPLASLLDSPRLRTRSFAPARCLAGVRARRLSRPRPAHARQGLLRPLRRLRIAARPPTRPRARGARDAPDGAPNVACHDGDAECGGDGQIPPCGQPGAGRASLRAPAPRRRPRRRSHRRRRRAPHLPEQRRLLASLGALW